jgi:NAD-dependent dihydropyrimidine dehydrogenase PreA subunit
VTYVITAACVDVMDKTCIEECPVDCIYVGERALYIQPDECVDCGACEPVCPQNAIFYEDDLPADQVAHLEDNRVFFVEILPGRPEPLGSPMGNKKFGPVGQDTELIRNSPPAEKL